MKFFQKRMGQLMVVTTVLSLSACAQNSSGVTAAQNAVAVNQALSVQAMQLPVGETLTVRLASNPSTGYSWVLAENAGNALKQSKRSFEPKQSVDRVVGAGGVDVWQFEAVSAGQHTLRLEYRRPWEKDVAPLYVSVYKVTVK